MNWYIYVSVVVGLLLIRFFNNLYKYNRLTKFYNEYMEFISNRNLEFVQNKEEIKALLKEAGINDFGIIHQEFLGFGQYANMTVSGLDNMTVNRVDVVSNMQMRFQEAIGVFKKRYRDSYNPMFWLDFIIKLPQYLFEFFGVLPEKIVVKVFLILYWLLATLLSLRNTEFLEPLLNQFNV